jgi:hypothetical protein
MLLDRALVALAAPSSGIMMPSGHLERPRRQDGPPLHTFGMKPRADHKTTGELQYAVVQVGTTRGRRLQGTGIQS